MKDNTNEIKKKYLNSFQEQVRAVKRIEEQLMTLEKHEMLPKVQSFDAGPHGSRVIRDLSDYVVKKDELISKMLRARYKRVELYTDIFDAIEIMDSETEREVLTLRYIKGEDWESIAVKMGYQWAQVHRIHAKALKHFEIPKRC